MRLCARFHSSLESSQPSRRAQLDALTSADLPALLLSLLPFIRSRLPVADRPAPRFELVSHTKRSASLPDLATARLQDLPEELFLAIVHATAPPLLEQEHKATEWQDFLDIIQFTNKAFYRAYRALFPNFVEYSYVRESMPEVTKAFIAKLADGQVMPSVRLVHVHLGDAPTGLKFDVFFDNLPNLHTFRHYRTFGSYRFTPFDFSLLSKAPSASLRLPTEAR